MSDIQAGDLVVCVDVKRRPWSTSAHMRKIRMGGTYRVSKVVRFGDLIGLHLVGAPVPGGFLAERFRKVRPAEEEFTELVRKMRPIKIPVQS